MLIALPALAFATSCVPQPPVRTARVPKPLAPPVLLQQLDLKIPVDLTQATLGSGQSVMPAAAGAPPFLVSTRTPDDASRAIDCLTAAVYYEARSQSLDGQRAVAQVVLNRVRDRAFPASVCGVVYQGSTRSTGCQFSFTCDGSLYRPKEPRAWAQAHVIATAALAGAVYAPVGSATFYHADYVSPWWAQSMTRVATVGAHEFYRWRGAMENALAFRQSYSGLEAMPSAPWREATIAGLTDDGGISLEIVRGVTIHRATGAVDVARPETAHSTLVAGVRVHHGQLAPVLENDAMSATDTSGPI